MFILIDQLYLLIITQTIEKHLANTLYLHFRNFVELNKLKRILIQLNSSDQNKIFKIYKFFKKYKIIKIFV